MQTTEALVGGSLPSEAALFPMLKRV